MHSSRVTVLNEVVVGAIHGVHQRHLLLSRLHGVEDSAVVKLQEFAHRTFTHTRTGGARTRTCVRARLARHFLRIGEQRQEKRPAEAAAGRGSSNHDASSKGQSCERPIHQPAAFDISRLCGVHDTAGSTRSIRQSRIVLEDPAAPTSFTVPAPQGVSRGLEYSVWLYEVTYLRRLRQEEAI